MNVDFWDKRKWDEELERNQVIVMTGQILLDMLSHSYITFNDIALLVIDEVHWAAKRKGKKETGHCYKRIMNMYNNHKGVRPRILGLSATPINCSMKVDNFDEAIADIETTYSAVCKTGDAGNYGTNPMELIWQFMCAKSCQSPTAQIVVTTLDQFIAFLKTFKNTQKLPSTVTKLKKTFSNIRNMLKTPDNVTIIDDQLGQAFPVTMTWMGVWSACVCIDKYVEEIDEQKNLYQDFDAIHARMLDLALKFLNMIKSIIDTEIKLDPMAALTTASPKMHRLLEILDKYRPKSGTEPTICGIIFVNQRCVAKVLSQWLTKLKELQPEKYGFLEVDAVVGHSVRPGFETKLVSNSDKKQQLIIERFHKKQLNLLVATSVLEEGLDVRKCNLVIRYDKLNTFREYLQSKGRARADNAHFYLMTRAEESAKLNQTLNDFHIMENKIKYLNARDSKKMNSYEASNDPIQFDRSFINDETNARITEWSAIQMLYRYCNNLPSDSFTRLEPVFEVIPYSTGFKASVQMPVNCPLRGQVIEEVANGKDEAKRNVALKTCKELFKCGELNEHLLPISKEQFIDKYIEKLGLSKETFMENMNGDHKVGTRSRRQVVPKKFAKVFTKSEDNLNRYYLHRIEIDSKSKLCFGLLTTKSVLNECLFPVYNKSKGPALESTFKAFEESRVKFTSLDQICLSDDQKQSIMKFHYFTFEEALRLSTKDLTFDFDNCKLHLLVVPLINGQTIDWSFINKVKICDTIEAKPLSDTKRKEFVFNANTFEDSVFYPSYRTEIGSDKPDLYFFEHISGLTANSLWEGKNKDIYTTFYHYYLKKHEINIDRKDDPLIHGIPVPSSKKGQFKGAQLKDLEIIKRNGNKIKEYFPAELLLIHPFPASLFRQALCLPAIIYRLNHLFLAEELRHDIHSDAKYDCLDIDFITKLNNKRKRNSINSSDEEEVEEGEKFSDDEDGCNGHPFENRMKWVFINPSKKFKIKCPIITDEIDPTSRPNPSSGPVLNPNLSSNNSFNALSQTKTIIGEFLVLINNYSDNFNHQRDQQILEKCLREMEFEEMVNYDKKLMYGEAFPFICVGDVDPYIRCTYDDRVGDPIERPGAATLLRALTLTGASDAFNLERLEVIGDSFLKLVSSAFVYFSCPELDEGRLSYLKQIQICNCNLYLIGIEKGIDKLLVAHKWFPNQNWLLPGYDIEEDTDQRLMNQNKHKCGSFKHNLVSDKSVADSVEALIGAHLLIESGSDIKKRFSTKGALQFMEWLGLKVSPNDQKIDYNNEKLVDNNEIFRWLPTPKDPIVGREERTDINQFLENLYFGAYLAAFEENIGYKFKNKAYLVQSLTHSSYLDNKFTDCYQSLEFLGDAILDYLISCHIYLTPNKEFSPGELTDLRSALVNNSFFAAIAVKYKFNKYLKNMSSGLFHAIQAFEKNFFAEGEVNAVKMSFSQMTEEECDDLEEIEVPKALGDIFESVAGAIWLDSGFSLDEVWRIYFKMLKPEIDYFTANIPQMPVKQLRETCKDQVFFGKSEQIGRKIRVKLIADGKEYSGVGQNRKLAKISAAKCALKDKKVFKI